MINRTLIKNLKLVYHVKKNNLIVSDYKFHQYVHKLILSNNGIVYCYFNYTMIGFLL